MAKLAMCTIIHAGVVRDATTSMGWTNWMTM